MVFFPSMKFTKSYDSYGKIHVFGKKLNSLGINFYISFRYLAKLFFKLIIVIPGK